MGNEALKFVATDHPCLVPPTDRANGLLPLVAEGVSFEAGGRRLVDRLSLQVKHGPLTVIMGPNGAGKSLLLRLLHGLIAPSTGRITWGGVAAGPAIRRRQAMVFQKPVLLRRSVAANVDFVLHLHQRVDANRRHALLERVGLADHADTPARKLSGGEQQRLALARALAIEPAVMLLDEPTASLDPASVLRIETLVREAHTAGTKVIFVTHDIGQARRLADEVVFLHRGRVVEHTSAARFFTQTASTEASGYLAGRIVL